MKNHIHDLKTGEIRQEDILAEEAAQREAERAVALKQLAEEQAYEKLGETLRAATEPLEGTHYSKLTATHVRDLLAMLLYERKLLDAEGNVRVIKDTQT